MKIILLHKILYLHLRYFFILCIVLYYGRCIIYRHPNRKNIYWIKLLTCALCGWSSYSVLENYYCTIYLLNSDLEKHLNITWIHLHYLSEKMLLLILCSGIHLHLIWFCSNIKEYLLRSSVFNRSICAKPDITALFCSTLKLFVIDM